MTRYCGKKDLVDVYANKHDCTKAEAERILKDMELTLKEVLLDPNYKGLQIIGFLTLERVIRKARPGRNIRTKEVIQIPERTTLKLSLGENFKNELKEM